MISNIREYYNPLKPAKGLRVIYTYKENQLRSVVMIPPKSQCTGCSSEYYFDFDTLVTKKERLYKKIDAGIFVNQSHSFQASLPSYLPWGYFQEEILVNGKMKKNKPGY